MEPQGPPRCGHPLTFLLVTKARAAWRQGSATATASLSLVFVWAKLSYARRSEDASFRAGSRNRAGPHLGAQDQALLTPCPFAIFPVCRAYLGAGFELATLFLLEEILRHKRNGAIPGGDREQVSSVHKAWPSPRPWGDGGRPCGPSARGPLGLPGPRGWPRVGIHLLSCGPRLPLQGGLCGSCALEEPGACTGPSALPKAASLLSSDLSEHNGTAPTSYLSFALLNHRWVCRIQRW